MTHAPLVALCHASYTTVHDAAIHSISDWLAVIEPAHIVSTIAALKFLLLLMIYERFQDVFKHGILVSQACFLAQLSKSLSVVIIAAAPSCIARAR